MADLRPDPSLNRDEMEPLQREVACTATFGDDLPFAPGDVAVDDPIEAGQATPGGDSGGPTVVGIDQAFREAVAVSAAVAIRDGRVVEYGVGRTPLEMEYVPGLLSFREAPAILDAIEDLSVEPDLLVVDGNGRIHFRQAGIATHVGVLLDMPAVGVAKSLLCGEPGAPLEDPLPEGERVAIEADDSIEEVDESGEWPVIGYAYQSRQYPDPERRHVNPLFVSPGHRVGATTAVELVAALSGGYKLPEPTRLADAHADTL